MGKVMMPANLVDTREKALSTWTVAREREGRENFNFNPEKGTGERKREKEKKGGKRETEDWVAQIQCGKHHRAPEGAQPRHAGTPHAGGTRAGGANLPSLPGVPRRHTQAATPEPQLNRP